MRTVATAVLAILIAAHAAVDGGSGFAGERAFVEGRLAAADTVGCRTARRPIACAVAAGKEFTVIFTARKYMRKTNAETTLALQIPPELQVVSGAVTKSGTAVEQRLQVRVRAPHKTGSFVIVGVAKNMALGFTSQSRLEIVVHSSRKAAQRWLAE